MTLDDAVASACERGVARSRRVGGGCINDGYEVTFGDGGRAFVKTRQDVAAGEYAAEAASLRWLAEPGVVRVPEVLGVREEPPRLLALSWVDSGRLSEAGAERFGRGLAELHAAGAEAFGARAPEAGADAASAGSEASIGSAGPSAAAQPLRLGSVALDTHPPLDRWPEFYAERFLRPLARAARDQGSLTSAGAAAIDSVCDDIERLAGPPEPPARLHGDLWSGNVLADTDGEAWLIDPAAYGGHREIDLAMLRLFGAPSPRILAAYEETHPLADGHADRVELLQLFPLLVHAVLFGGGYGAQAERAARRYARA